MYNLFRIYLLLTSVNCYLLSLNTKSRFSFIIMAQNEVNTNDQVLSLQTRITNALNDHKNGLFKIAAQKYLDVGYK